MDVLPSEMPAGPAATASAMVAGYTAAETMVVPSVIPSTTTGNAGALSSISSASSNPTDGASSGALASAVGYGPASAGAGACPSIAVNPAMTSGRMVDNVALPPSSKSVIETSGMAPQNTIVTHLSSKSTPQVTVVAASEAVIQVIMKISAILVKI